MIYENLFSRAGDRPIHAGLIGTGTYGISLISQAQFIPRLKVPVVCDRAPDTAMQACIQAGISKERITICNNTRQILQAMEKEKIAIAENYELLMDIPLDVIVECTGNPEAGARHAELAIKSGKHVAMVNKETDSVIGPILSRLADKAGLSYTPVDGDQPGLLIGLVSWAQSIGLEVVCGGKARPYDFIYDEPAKTVSNGAIEITLTGNKKTALAKIGEGAAGRVIETRRKALDEFPLIGEADLCESVVAGNATGLMADIPTMHAPIVRTAEIADVLCPEEEGGILNNRGVVEVITCLRRENEAGLGGGVFIVFSCKNDPTWNFVKEKGLLTNHRGTCGVVYRPYHLLGVETPISILCAGLLNLSTGSLNDKPRLDLIAKTKKDLEAGSIMESGHGHLNNIFEHLVVPVSPISRDNSVPFYMAVGNQVKVDVPTGSTLTYEMINEPENSKLWDLRRQQDEAFNI